MPLITDFAKDQVLMILREFFKKHNQYRWNGNSKETQLLIVDKFTVNLESVVSEKLPALVVGRGPMQWRNVSIGQRADGTTPNPACGRKYVDIVDTTFTINCLSRRGLEAEILASNVFSLFSFFRDEMRRVRAIHEIQSTQLGVEQIGRADSDTQISTVPVQIRMIINQVWNSEDMNAELLQSISVKPEIYSRALENARKWDCFQRSLRSTS